MPFHLKSPWAISLWRFQLMALNLFFQQNTKMYKIRKDSYLLYCVNVNVSMDTIIEVLHVFLPPYHFHRIYISQKWLNVRQHVFPNGLSARQMEFCLLCFDLIHNFCHSSRFCSESDTCHAVDVFRNTHKTQQRIVYQLFSNVY